MDFIALCLAMFLSYWVVYLILESFTSEKVAQITMILSLMVFLIVTWALIGDEVWLNIESMPNSNQLVFILGIGFTIFFMHLWKYLDETAKQFHSLKRIFDWFFIHKIAPRGLWGYEYQKRRVYFTANRRFGKNKILGDDRHGWIVRETSRHFYVIDYEGTVYKLYKKQYQHPDNRMKLEFLPNE